MPKILFFVIEGLIIFIVFIISMIYAFYDVLDAKYTFSIFIGAIISSLSIVALTLNITSNYLNIRKNTRQFT